MANQLIDLLNKVLEQEHACAIRYATHAAMVSGPYAEAVAARFKEIAGDEIMHAEMLRDRIITLGGVPSMQVSADDLKHGDNLETMLNINIAEEKHAIKAYLAILKNIPADNIILHRTIEDIIRDEQEHLEELENLVAGH
ncbi:MAG: hypothetical protein A3F17_00800 [Gammaproteobacteria bacterium RIFCSPHIGHO2_12_FULL_41_15]|nr:MAG: hypothetical protein A3F17_00800 [Gammaproteobacteria bacterium RIFCSPHIGHO2_12_FULL_41_15]